MTSFKRIPPVYLKFEFGYPAVERSLHCTVYRVAMSWLLLEEFIIYYVVSVLHF